MYNQTSFDTLAISYLLPSCLTYLVEQSSYSGFQSIQPLLLIEKKRSMLILSFLTRKNDINEPFYQNQIEIIFLFTLKYLLGMGRQIH